MDTIKFTPEIITKVNEAAKSEHITVEVNISKRTAHGRIDSDAPALTSEVLLEKGDPTTTVIMNVGADEPLELEVLNGVPFSVEAAQLRLVSQYKDESDDALELAEARLLATKLITSPRFSYKQRKRKGVIPLEDYPDEYLSMLMTACNAVIYPDTDDVYQVRILREMPESTDKRILSCFRRFPKAIDYINTQPGLLTPKQAKMVEHLRHRLREIVLEDLISSPNLFTNNSNKQNITDGYPLSVLSESILQSLFSAVCIAHKLPNIL